MLRGEAAALMDTPFFEMLGTNAFANGSGMAEAFDLETFRKTGLQVVRNFFEPELREKLGALGRHIVEEVRSQRVNRVNQFLDGFNVDADALLGSSTALRAAAGQVLGPDICWLNVRVLMKDRSFRDSITVHQDWPYFGGDTRKLNVFVPLTRCRRENGMLVFYEGSHTLGPVERGVIDIDRYPDFAPNCPTLEVGDVLLADFLAWHSSIPAEVDDERILLQLVLQPASDRSSNNVLGKGWQPLGPVNPFRTTPMSETTPSVGVGPARAFLGSGRLDEAASIARGLKADSALNVEAHLLLHDIAVRRGEDGADFVDAAEAALTTLAEQVSGLRGGPGVDVGGAGLQARIDHLEAALAQVETSTSWRMTAPLRWIRSALSSRRA
jgi:hypothetical protein